jgi:hypothetical protein
MSKGGPRGDGDEEREVGDDGGQTEDGMESVWDGEGDG